MTVRYGKVGDKLIALKETGRQNNRLLVDGYEMLFEINEHDINQVIAMLLTAGMTGISFWRLQQFINFYEISNNEFIHFIERYDITATKSDETFILEAIAPSDLGIIRIQTENLFAGIVQVLISMGKRIPL